MRWPDQISEASPTFLLGHLVLHWVWTCWDRTDGKRSVIAMYFDPGAITSPTKTGVVRKSSTQKCRLAWEMCVPRVVLSNINILTHPTQGHDIWECNVFKKTSLPIVSILQVVHCAVCIRTKYRKKKKSLSKVSKEHISENYPCTQDKWNLQINHVLHSSLRKKTTHCQSTISSKHTSTKSARSGPRVNFSANLGDFWWFCLGKFLGSPTCAEMYHLTTWRIIPVDGK